MITISLCMIVKNEEKVLARCLDSIADLMDEIIIVDTGSSDNTKEICRKNKYNTINLIQNLGIGGAVQTGYKYALNNNCDVAIQFDGDGQHDEN